MLYNIFKLKNLDVRIVGNIGKPPLKEIKIEKKQYLLLRHRLTKYLTASILKPILLLF